MTLPLGSPTLFRLAGALGMVGCVVRAPPIPPPASAQASMADALAVDPCSVSRDPEISVRGTAFDVLKPLYENLDFLRAANPVFLCGLARVEALGDDDYKASADPIYTRRSVGLYTRDDRVIHLKASAGITLTHEVGHHIQNLGYFAPTLRVFFDQSWKEDAHGRMSPKCGGFDCFVNDAAAESPSEDWARTFEMVLMRSIETAAATNFPLGADGPTPMRKKIELVRSIAATPEPARAAIAFGAARALDAAEAAKWKGVDRSPDLPATLPPETVRRIFQRGKRGVRSWVWDNRRRPFQAGDLIVFPAFLERAKNLGFFAYDLKQDRYVPLTLDLESVPKEFKEAAGSFADLQLVEDAGALRLVGHFADGTAIDAPVTFTQPRSPQKP